MSKPRPIHSSPRVLRSTPDEAEPSFSYEQESFLGDKEVDVEDEFHRRLAGSRRETAHSSGIGQSFWRNSTTSSAGEGSASSQAPLFSSVSISAKNDSMREQRSSGVLADSMQSSYGEMDETDASRDHVSFMHSQVQDYVSS
jgi:hypothetical protein